jgi:uncharacterized protein YdeI (YjbR/CyaY-like superfamily)
MAKTKLSEGVAHKIPDDLRKALESDTSVIEKWEDLTPLARNEWICWTISVKKGDTRKDHIKRTKEELLEGKRRPCCWIGCIHRADKSTSPSQKYVLSKQKSRKN